MTLRATDVVSTRRVYDSSVATQASPAAIKEINNGTRNLSAIELSKLMHSIDVWFDRAGRGESPEVPGLPVGRRVRIDLSAVTSGPEAGLQASGLVVKSGLTHGYKAPMDSTRWVDVLVAEGDRPRIVTIKWTSLFVSPQQLTQVGIKVL